MKRGPLLLRLQKQSQSGQQDNNGRISETGNKYFFVFLAKTLPLWRTTIGTLARTPKVGNMYSEEIMLHIYKKLHIYMQFRRIYVAHI